MRTNNYRVQLEAEAKELENTKTKENDELKGQLEVINHAPFSEF